MAKVGKRLRALRAGIQREAFYGVDDAVKMVRERRSRSP